MRYKIFSILLVCFLGSRAVAQLSPPATMFPRVVTDTLSRDSAVSAYASGDAWGDRLLVFPLGTRSTAGSGGCLVSVDVVADTLNTTNAFFDVLIFSDSAGLTKPTDNSPYELSGTQLGIPSKFIGDALTSLTVTYGTAGNRAAAIGTYDFAPPRVYWLSSGSTLYGVVVVRGAYTPAYAGKLYVTLRLLRQ